jgi:hypothetical protein
MDLGWREEAKATGIELEEGLLSAIGIAEALGKATTIWKECSMCEDQRAE